MQTFSVEDDVIAMVWQAAKPRPFETLTFNDALRRILIKQSVLEISGRNADVSDLLRDELNNNSFARKRAPRADLQQLVKLGKLKEGQRLYFVDYRGNLDKDVYASISGQDIIFEGHHYSMTALARNFLQKSGYVGGAVRGPAHWALQDGSRVCDIWQATLNQPT